MFSTKQLQSALTSFLRRHWMSYSDERKEIIQSTKVFTDKSFKRATGHRCFICDEVVKQREFKVHHIIPIGSLSIANVEHYVKALFCKKSLLVGLCQNCHLELHKEMKSVEKELSPILLLNNLTKTLKNLEKTEHKSYVLIAKFLLTKLLEETQKNLLCRLNTVIMSKDFAKLVKKYAILDSLEIFYDFEKKVLDKEKCLIKLSSE